MKKNNMLNKWVNGPHPILDRQDAIGILARGVSGFFMMWGILGYALAKKIQDDHQKTKRAANV